MSDSVATRYAVWSGAIAAGAGLALLPFALSGGVSAFGWAVLGWLVMVVPGVAGGSWLAAVHGKLGSAFLVAMGACILARLIASAAGAAAAAMHGMGVVWPYLTGLGVGFLPLQVFEVGWFYRRARSGS